jgi:hypothetical protein
MGGIDIADEPVPTRWVDFFITWTSRSEGSERRQPEAERRVSRPFREISALLKRATCDPSNFLVGPVTFRANEFAPRIRAAQRDAWHLQGPSQIGFGAHRISRHATAMINKMTAPDVTRGGGRDDRADRQEGIDIGEEIYEPSVRAAQL